MKEETADLTTIPTTAWLMHRDQEEVEADIHLIHSPFNGLTARERTV